MCSPNNPQHAAGAATVTGNAPSTTLALSSVCARVDASASVNVAPLPPVELLSCS
jgi:hypothetical protein